MSFEIDGQTRGIADGLLYAFHVRYSVVGARVVWEAKVRREADDARLLRGAATVANGQPERNASEVVLSSVRAAINRSGEHAANATAY